MNSYNNNVNRLLLGTAIGFLILFKTGRLQAQEPVRNYREYSGSAAYQGTEWVILRQLEMKGADYFLAVNPQLLTTSLIPAGQARVKQMPKDQTRIYFASTPYIKALEAAAKQSTALQDAGIVHGYPKEKGITLTIDLCPSHKAMDRIIFTSLIAEFKKIEQPVPVALSITGRWMLTHADDLNWLKSLEAQQEIAITWTDHTYNHHFSPSAPLATNFLLAPGTDLNFEILGTELAMIQHGLLPSVFFRFPGLVSDQRVVTQVLSYGVIPVGSDAWLAKGQQPSAGSIVLIHGNGNEPVGVADFIRLLRSRSADIMDKQWLMYDLSESVEDEFSK